MNTSEQCLSLALWPRSLGVLYFKIKLLHMLDFQKSRVLP